MDRRGKPTTFSHVHIAFSYPFSGKAYQWAKPQQYCGLLLFKMYSFKAILLRKISQFGGEDSRIQYVVVSLLSYS